MRALRCRRRDLYTVHWRALRTSNNQANGTCYRKVHSIDAKDRPVTRTKTRKGHPEAAFHCET